MKEPIRKFFINPFMWGGFTLLIFLWLWVTDASPEDPRGYLTFIPALVMTILAFTGALDYLTRKHD